MRFLHKLGTFLLALALLAGAYLPVKAQATNPPSVLGPPPSVPGGTQLSGLKAVLIVGPIDGDTGKWTRAEIANMELAAVELESNGVQVTRFYTPNNDWNQIKTAAQGAHFLLYRGHGVGSISDNSESVGGFSLKNNFISNEQIAALDLHPNAIVMLYGCYTAGGDDKYEIAESSADAQRRVAQYSQPFFSAGAGGYFASWYGDAFQLYIRALFAGKTLGKAYESGPAFNLATVEHHTHPQDASLALWLNQTEVTGGYQYTNAFSGKADLTLAQLFSALDVSTDEIVRIVDLGAAPSSEPVTVTVLGSQSVTWTATPNANWIAVNPDSATGSGQFEVSFAPSNTPGQLTGEIHVIGDGLDAANNVHVIQVRVIYCELDEFIYLPMVTKH